ncbi:MAG: PDZ domain-containing protein [Candidatus Eiseniibacteriota bacterium]|nr:MAG: PDZ domain-containing protein [Candidatus Eisenbacteria bacterium]
MVASSRVAAALIVVAVVVSLTTAGSSAVAGPASCCPPELGCLVRAGDGGESGPCCARLVKCAAQSYKKSDTSGGGWLGVHIQDLTSELREVMGLEESTEGALVSDVDEGSPADKAGIKKGDVIVRVDQKPVEGVEQLVALVKKRGPGDQVVVVVLREGTKKKLTATLGKAPKRKLEEIEFDVDEKLFGDKDSFTYKLKPFEKSLTLNLDRAYLGVSVVDVKEELAEYFGTDKGALVIEVQEDSGAEEAGVKPGDVIIEADGKPVEDSGDLTRLLREREKGDSVELVLFRKGKTMKLDAVLGEGPGWALIEGAKKGMFIPEMPHLRLERAPKGPEEGVELRLKMEALDRAMKKLQKKLEKLSEELESLRD